MEARTCWLRAMNQARGFAWTPGAVPQVAVTGNTYGTDDSFPDSVQSHDSHAKT